MPALSERRQTALDDLKKQAAALSTVSREMNEMLASKRPQELRPSGALKAISAAAYACEAALVAAGDEDPIPWALIQGIQENQMLIQDTANALVIFHELAKR